MPVVVAETTTDARGESDERLSERRLRVPMIDRVRRHFHVVVQMPNNGDDVFFLWEGQTITNSASYILSI